MGRGFSWGLLKEIMNCAPKYHYGFLSAVFAFEKGNRIVVLHFQSFSSIPYVLAFEYAGKFRPSDMLLRGLERYLC